MAKQKKKRRQWRNPTYIGTVLVAVVFIFIFIVSFISPGGSSVTTDADIDTAPTPEPTPLTAPTVEPGGPSLTFGSPTVQSNGLFEMTVPGGWFPGTNFYEASVPQARISFTNADRLSVIEGIIRFGVNYPSHQALSDDFLTEEFFLSAWGDYDTWVERDRSVGDAITINFDMSVGGLDLLGRQIAWLDGDWLNMLRLVVPRNYPALMEELERVVTPTLVSFQQDQRDLPPELNAYVDTEQGFLVRHPGWVRVSGSPGRPAVLESQQVEGRLLLRASEETPIDSLDDAEAYVTETLRPGAEVLSSQITAREFAAGFMVSYQDRDADGNAIAGLVALLNNDIERLLVAEIRLTAGDLDLLTASEDERVTQSRQIIDSFAALPPPGYLIAPAENPPAAEETPEVDADTGDTTEGDADTGDTTEGDADTGDTE
jgi:hypothetical protein